MNVLSVLRKGRRHKGDVIDITWKKRFDRRPSAVRVVVSQKVAKKAVERHTIQRRLREIARAVLKTNSFFTDGYDIVIVARPPASRASFYDLQKSVYSTLNQH